MTLQFKGGEIEITEFHKFHVSESDKENIFFNKNNRTLNEMLEKQRYNNLTPLIHEYLDDYGEIKIGEFLKHLKEKNDIKYKKFLNKNGDKKYCEVILENVDLSRKGLYVFVVNNVIMYLGRSSKIAYKSRLKGDYFRITPAKCYRTGQSTSCRVNSLINSSIDDVYVGLYPMEGVAQINNLESQILSSNKFLWNVHRR